MNYLIRNFEVSKFQCFEVWIFFQASKILSFPSFKNFRASKFHNFNISILKISKVKVFKMCGTHISQTEISDGCRNNIVCKSFGDLLVVLKVFLQKWRSQSQVIRRQPNKHYLSDLQGSWNVRPYIWPPQPSCSSDNTTTAL